MKRSCVVSASLDKTDYIQNPQQSVLHKMQYALFICKGEDFLYQ